jgi:hypothetical protein
LGLELVAALGPVRPPDAPILHACPQAQRCAYNPVAIRALVIHRDRADLRMRALDPGVIPVYPATGAIPRCFAFGKAYEGLAAKQYRQAIHAFHTDCHFFAIAANKLLEYRDWVRTFRLCALVDFGEVAQFSAGDIKDLRDMREHIIDYFSGIAREPDRWIVKTADYEADASAE